MSQRCMVSLFSAQGKDDGFLHFLSSAYLPFFYLPQPLSVLRDNLVPLVATQTGQTPYSPPSSSTSSSRKVGPAR